MTQNLWIMSSFYRFAFSTEMRTRNEHFHLFMVNTYFECMLVLINLFDIWWMEKANCEHWHMNDDNILIINNNYRWEMACKINMKTSSAICSNNSIDSRKSEKERCIATGIILILTFCFELHIFLSLFIF